MWGVFQASLGFKLIILLVDWSFKVINKISASHNNSFCVKTQLERMEHVVNERIDSNNVKRKKMEVWPKKPFKHRWPLLHFFVILCVLSARNASLLFAILCMKLLYRNIYIHKDVCHYVNKMILQRPEIRYYEILIY